MRNICQSFIMYPNLTLYTICFMLCAPLCVGRNSYARTARTHGATAFTAPTSASGPRRGNRFCASTGVPYPAITEIHGANDFPIWKKGQPQNGVLWP